MPKEVFKIPNPDLEERKVRLDRETLCALDRAFQQNPGVAKELEGIVGEDTVRIFKDILANTLDPAHRAEITFIPDKEEVRTIYGQIAKRELERIEAEDEDDEDLTCGHTVDEHREALETLVGKMNPTVN